VIYDSLSIGVVVATYPAGNSVDVLMDDGSRLSNVQVLVPSGSSDSGIFDLPHVDGAGQERRWDFTRERNRSVRAMVARTRGAPVVVGFLLPQVCQMTFDERNRRIMRHPSDVYTSIDDAGNMEIAHPGGAFVRIGTSPDHEDLTGKDFDKKWKISRNTDKQAYIRVSIPGKVTLTMTPAGEVSLETSGGISAEAGGAVNIQAPSVTLDTPATTCTGALTVQGLLTYQAGMAGTGGTAGNTISGTITVTSGDVKADGVGLKTHRHQEHDGPSTGTASG